MVAVSFGQTCKIKKCGWGYKFIRYNTATFNGQSYLLAGQISADGVAWDNYTTIEQASNINLVAGGFEIVDENLFPFPCIQPL